MSVMLPGNRLHLQHGPIDLIVEAFGVEREVGRAYDQAKARFATLLDELVGELPKLKSRCPADGMKLQGSVARRMERAVRPFAQEFITPMAAVAGSVSDEMLATLTAGRRLDRAYVNNGGDLAIFLAPNERFRLGVAPDPRFAKLLGAVPIDAADGIGGVATSGRRGRSFSLGIADAVTIAAANAAEADAAATMVANAVDLPGSPKVRRAPARSVDPGTDLKERPVTLNVAPLAAAEVAHALSNGVTYARTLLRVGRIKAALLTLQGTARAVGLWERALIQATEPAHA